MDFDRKILIDIGNKCKELRNEIKFTQKDMALELKVPLTTIENFEYGKSNNAILYHAYMLIHKQYTSK